MKSDKGSIESEKGSIESKKGLLSDRNKILNDEQTNNRINPKSKPIKKKTLYFLKKII